MIWSLFIVSWLVLGFGLALLFGQVATLGRTQEEQDAEDLAQMEYLDNYVNRD